MATATKSKPKSTQSKPLSVETVNAEPTNNGTPKITTIETFGFDGGNRYPKFGYDDRARKLLSYRAVVPSFQEIKPADLPTGTHLVEIGAIRSVVGAGAVGYGARPTCNGLKTRSLGLANKAILNSD